MSGEIISESHVQRLPVPLPAGFKVGAFAVVAISETGQINVCAPFDRPDLCLLLSARLVEMVNKSVYEAMQFAKQESRIVQPAPSSAIRLV